MTPTINDVRHTETTEIISWTMIGNYPTPDKKSRVNLYFNVESTFDKTSGKWASSVYRQYVPENGKS